MSKTIKNPLIHQIKIEFLIPQIAILLLFIFLFRLIGLDGYVFIGLAVYFLVSLYLKIIIPRSHRKGIFYLKKSEYHGAALCFEQSLRFFTKNLWIDTYRAYTLFSISSISYREMAIINALYCYRKTGDTSKCLEYEKALRQIRSK